MDNQEVITLMPFDDVNIEDEFFNSLREDYEDFNEWFSRKLKAGEKAYVQLDENNAVQAFLYLKFENEPLPDVIPPRPALKRLKVGTFKVNGHNTRLGERLIKIILDLAIDKSCVEVYLTTFEKQKKLIEFIGIYGFVEAGKKGSESVFVRQLNIISGDILRDFPFISTKNKRKYLLSIYPKYHTKLFPDSILKNEENIRYELVKDVTHTNSIHKIYLCFMPDTAMLVPGDLIAIYRTKDGLGPAKYRSVVTSICQIEEVRVKDSFKDVNEFVEYTNAYSIFDPIELRGWFSQRNLVVLKMTYNIALTKRVTRGYLIDEIGMAESIYWGFFELSDSQFEAILKKGEINENIIIN